MVGDEVLPGDGEIANILHGPAAVGVFSIGQQLVDKMHLPMESVQDAVYRRISRLPAAEAKAAINRYVRISGWLMWLILVAAGVVLPVAIHMVLGPSYGPAVAVVFALIPGAVVMSTAALLATFFVAQQGRPGLAWLLAALALGIILLLSLALIPSFGVTGAALAVAGTQILVTSLALVIYRRTTGSRFVELVRIERADLALLGEQARQLRLAGKSRG